MSTNPETCCPPTRRSSCPLTADDARHHLHEYFTKKGSGNRPWYSGARFELFAGGGDHPDSQDRMTAEDLVATSFLSVDIPGGLPRTSWRANSAVR